MGDWVQLGGGLGRLISNSQLREQNQDGFMSTFNKKELRSSRELLLDKVERITEIPLMILSLIMIPLLLGPVLWDMLENEERLFFIGDILIWALFAVDMVVKTALSTNRVNL